MKVSSKKFRIVNKDRSIEGEYDTEEAAILDCWLVFGQKVTVAATGEIIYPKK